VKKAKKVNQLNRAQGDRSEQNIARAVSLIRQEGSGCGIIHRQDLRSDDYDILCQVKSTRTDRITIRMRDLEKLMKDARDRESNFVALFVDFVGPKPVRAPRTWALITQEEWKAWRKARKSRR
jgi:hypothetical protein